MKKLLSSFFIILLFVFLLCIDVKSDNYEIRIPVHITKNGKFVKNLSVDNFELYLKDKQVKNFKFEEFSKSFLNNKIPLNYYVLEFNLISYSSQIGKAIDFFIDNILKKDDGIIIITRNKIYSSVNFTSKENLKENIKQYVKKDTLEYKGKINSYMKNMESLLNKLEMDQESIKRFVESYSREWNIYKKMLLIPPTDKYITVVNSLTKKCGNKWWINFQARELIPHYGKFKRKMRDIENFLTDTMSQEKTSGWTEGVLKAKNNLKSDFLVSDIIPAEKLSKLFIGANINYSSIFFRNRLEKKGAGSFFEITPNYEETIKKISDNIGGNYITNDNLINAINSLSNMNTYYYLFETNVKKENDYKIKIKPTTLSEKKHDIYYRDNFNKEYFNKVNLIDVFVKNKQIGFKIRDYKMKKIEGKTSGMIYVKITVKDFNGNIAYQTSNTLKTVNNEIRVNLPPVNISGEYKLYIIAKDYVSETSSFSSGTFNF